MKTTTKRAATKTSTVPSLADLLDTIGYHVATVMTHAPGPTVMHLEAISFGCGVGGFEGTDCPLVILEGSIRAASGSDPWGAWAQVTIGGERVGNRHGGYKAIMKAYAPVVAWVAAYHAAAVVEPAAATAGPSLAKAVA